MEPAQVPGTFQKAFQLMREGRPGPVLIDLPIDVQLAEIEFDIDTYEPLPVTRPAATRKQAEKALPMLIEAERPLIVAGGGVINADASDLLVELAEVTGVPVVPTLMGWGTIPDDHPLNAGMVGLQTSHRYGNATMLVATSCSASATGGPTATPAASTPTPAAARSCTSTSSRPRSAGSSRRTTAIVSDASAALEVFVEVAKEWTATAGWPTAAAWAESCRAQADPAAQDPLRQRPDQAAAGLPGDEQAFGPDTRYVTTIGLSQIQAAQLLHVYKPRHWINAGQAGPLGWTLPAALGGRDRRPRRHGRRALGRLRLPVPDRGAGGRRPVQHPLHPRGREQLLPRPDPPGPARVRDGLLRPARPSTTSTAPSSTATASTTSRSPKAWAARRSG